MDASPVDEDGFILVPGVGHLHAGHHEAVHAPTLTVQVHLTSITEGLVSPTSMLRGVPGLTLSSSSTRVPACLTPTLSTGTGARPSTSPVISTS